MSFKEWFVKRSPVPEMWRDHMAEYYAPKNFNIFYYAGSLLLLMVALQFVSGMFVLMHYKDTAHSAYASVMGIMYDVHWGWLMQYMHVDGVSLIFALLYLHMARGLLYGSYRSPREIVWIIGYALYVLFAAEAFFGYVLPYSNLSFWAGTVITAIAGSIPYIGGWLQMIMRGGSGISGDTLGRFLSFHVTLIFILILAMIVFHILYLHKVGSNNPDGIEIHDKEDENHVPLDGIPFHPYFSVKDLFGFGVFLTFFAWILFYEPSFFHIFLERTMSTPANPLKSLPDVNPPWYLAPYYAILRGYSIKMLGIGLMIASLVLPFLLPWLDRNPVKSTRYRPVTRVMLWIFFAAFCYLTYMGELPATPELIMPQRITGIVFLCFYILLPIVSSIEPTRQPPDRVRYHDGLLDRMLGRRH